MIIKNSDKIISHGNSKGRDIALDIIEHAISSVNTYQATKRRLKVRDNRILIGNLHYDLAEIRKVFVLGAGKATFSIAKALDELLDDKIERGVIIVKKGEKRRLKNIKVLEAGHPIPDEDGLKGVKVLLEIAQEAQERDLVLCAITGGASALMPSPAENISLNDKRDLTKELLKSGAPIDEMNAVRKHISTIKGGRLAKYIHPARIVNLLVMDEIAGQPWGPTVPDTTTFNDAIIVLKKYDLWDHTPISVRTHLSNGKSDLSLETLKPKDFEDFSFQNVILADNRMMCESARRRAEELGYDSSVLSTALEGESKQAGFFLASIAKEIEERGFPKKSPCILILAGETNVRIEGECGKGGPSQEFALGASLKIAGNKKIVIASIDTDGTDGPTEIAGGIVDGYTIERAKSKNIDISKSLSKHDSSKVLIRLQDALITSATDTNVMDLNVAVIIT